MADDLRETVHTVLWWLAGVYPPPPDPVAERQKWKAAHAEGKRAVERSLCRGQLEECPHVGDLADAWHRGVAEGQREHAGELELLAEMTSERDRRAALTEHRWGSRRTRRRQKSR